LTTHVDDGLALDLDGGSIPPTSIKLAGRMGYSFRLQNGRTVNFGMSPDSLCPCGSLKPVSECCLLNGQLKKAPANITPDPDSRTTPCIGCYASMLSDCAGKISREHFISRSLLDYMAVNNALAVTGFPWIDGTGRTLPPKALASKILCQRHNSALSILDDSAVRLFKAFDNRGLSESQQKLLFLFSGHDIERWLLKILCGAAFSKNLNLDRQVDLLIPRQWLEILFEDKEFPQASGLYICRDVGYTDRRSFDLGFRAISNRERLTGFGLKVCGYELILSMNGFPNRTFDGRVFVYRPFELRMTGIGFEKSILLSWEGPADNGTIERRVNISDKDNAM